jgi:peptide-methionine (S)-S-oxide reductase
VVAEPSYEQVCTGRTGHAEVVEVEYDPAKVSYDELLDVFFGLHDPTQKDRQGPDVGTQYRSAIFYHDEDQRRSAEAAKERAQGSRKRPVVTEISDAGTFYRAEEYHQRYFEKRGIASCPA